MLWIDFNRRVMPFTVLAATGPLGSLEQARRLFELGEVESVLLGQTAAPYGETISWTAASSGSDSSVGVAGCR